MTEIWLLTIGIILFSLVVSVGYQVASDSKPVTSAEMVSALQRVREQGGEAAMAHCLNRIRETRNPAPYLLTHIDLDQCEAAARRSRESVRQSDILREAATGQPVRQEDK